MNYTSEGSLFERSEHYLVELQFVDEESSEESPDSRFTYVERDLVRNLPKLEQFS
jgi:hypothetical protein